MAANGIVKPGRNGDVTTLTIPAEYVEDFRAAVVSEIKFEADRIVDHVRGDFTAVDVNFADVRTDAGLMAHDVALFDQLDGVEGDAELIVEGRLAIESLPHAFEKMATEIIAAKLEDEFGCSPIEAKDARRIRDLLDCAGWAVDRAAEYHAVGAEQCDAQRESGLDIPGRG